jgi:hypothetical protein
MMRCWQIEPQIHSASELESVGTKSALLANLCVEAGAQTYISGPFGREYIDRSVFERAGIELLFHDYAHPVYEQTYPGFEPYMSAVDLLMNAGPNGRDILETSNQTLSRT